ncbi:Pseudouridine synthase catalytic domain [Trinorchestia longiramus]|nr:Pseudouridine synthase catalytic domain [Trinorchestia longiramus]
MSSIDFLLENGCCRRCGLIYCGVRNFKYFSSAVAVDAKVEEVRNRPQSLDAFDFNAPVAVGASDQSGEFDLNKEREISSVSNGLSLTYSQVSSNKDQKDSVELSNGSLGQSPQPVCVSCLGLLQVHGTSRATITQMCERTKTENYDSPTFSLSISLPVSVSVRVHVIAAHLCKHRSLDSDKVLGTSVVAAIKDAWKAMVAVAVETALNKRYEGETADLCVPVTAHYTPDVQECSAAMAAAGYLGPTVKKQRNRRRRFCRRHKRDDDDNGLTSDAFSADSDTRNNSSHEQEKTNDCDPSIAGYSRQTVTAVLSGMTVEAIARLCPLQTLAVSSTPVSLAPDEPLREPIYVAGRYCKYSRELCQTPWIINGKAKCSESVEELISGPILPACRAQELKFLSSGREDVDVRCIGRGRPFALALQNPHRASLSRAELRRLQETINASTPHISVSHLQILDKESTSVLRFNQEDKVKCYTALCVVRDGGPRVCANFLKPLEGFAPVTIMQQTPVRVLHRRPLLTRPRVLHTMTAQHVNDRFFKVHLRSEAGTYIKELVHGDFGRTTPSLSSLLGCSVDIVALDVTDVELDWPPPVPDSDEE